jgi:hypothetical protein
MGANWILLPGHNSIYISKVGKAPSRQFRCRLYCNVSDNPVRELYLRLNAFTKELKRDSGSN